MRGISSNVPHVFPIPGGDGTSRFAYVNLAAGCAS
jgi:hypothetical protein